MKVQRIWIGENVFNFILIGDDYRPIDYVTQYMKIALGFLKTLYLLGIETEDKTIGVYAEYYSKC
jgi:hypothetical protein